MTYAFWPVCRALHERTVTLYLNTRFAVSLALHRDWKLERQQAILAHQHLNNNNNNNTHTHIHTVK